MEAQRSQFAVKCLPSLTDFAFLMPIAFLFGRLDGVHTLLSDGETGWHIRTGDWILANHLVPTRDLFSFSKPGGVWFAWEWLSDVIFAALNRMGGLRSVVLFSMLLLAVTFVVLFRLVLRRCNPVVGIVITMVAAATSSVHWLARPHLFTLFFLALFYFVLERAREGQRRTAGIPYFVLLPLVTILWTNLHGGFLAGIAMAATYGAGELLAAVFSANPAARRPALLRARTYSATALACLAASLVNPYGYHLQVHLFQYLRDPYTAQHITEFFTLSFHHPVAIFFEGLLAASAVSAFWYASRGRFTESLLLLSWGHAGLLMARHIPLFAIVAAPLVAGAVQTWLTRLPHFEVAEWLRTAGARFNGIVAKTAETDALPRWHVVSAAAVALVAALLYAPSPPPAFRAEYDPKSFPVAATEVLRRDPSARIFTHDEWGDYLIFRLYPKVRVFIDGRSDYYGDDFETQCLDVLNVNYDWEKILNGFGVDTILLPRSAPLAGVLKETSRWRVVYDDGAALIFRSVRKTAGNPISAASQGGGAGRDREVTKTTASDQAITGKIPYYLGAKHNDVFTQVLER
jgi:hypothetical protein